MNAVLGLSPRVRGSRPFPDRAGRHERSIPACTGQPQGFEDGSLSPRVYPRVYGAAWMASHPVSGSSGLSPRVRGSRPAAWSCQRGQRSIPACTGQPGAVHKAAKLPPVYPRVYGAAGAQHVVRASVFGLSPRVRGSLCMVKPSYGLLRSIPACTGQPLPRPGMRGCIRVYPRVYGAAP